jgi:hypothetical protein
MNGTAKKLVDSLITKRANGVKIIEDHIRIKLILKGIPLEQLSEDSVDNPVIIKKIKEVYDEFSVELN